jgi:hypothetical protein
MKITDRLRPLLTTTGYTGGAAGDLDALPTVAASAPLGLIAAVVNGGNISFHFLDTGTDATSSPTTIRGTDYNGATNQRVWRKLTVV